MRSSFLETSIIDLLEADPRPSFIVALIPHPPTVVYTNPAFGEHPCLLELVTAAKEDNAPLWEWISGGSTATTAGPSLSYSDTYWTRAVVNEEMVVVGANEQAKPPSKPVPPTIRVESTTPGPGPDKSIAEPTLRRTRPPVEFAETDTVIEIASERPPSAPVSPARPVHALDNRTKSTSAVVQTTTKDRLALRAETVQSLSLERSASDPGWILPDIDPDVIDSVNWAATPLGPQKSWSSRLEQTFNQILVDSRPIALYWGAEYTMIYNEAYSKLCGSRHPEMLGMSVDDAWHEAGKMLKDTMRSFSLKQKGVVEDEWRFFIEREAEVEGGPNWQEETYLKWSLIPVVENNEYLGFMHAVAETTSMRLWERRMKMLIDLGEVLITARDVKSYWEKTIEQLKAVDPQYDIPLAILYSVDEDPEASSVPPSPSLGPSKICRLEGALGVPEEHPIAPHTISLRMSDDGLAAAFREALKAPHPLLLQTHDESLPTHLLEGLQWRGFNDDPCRAAVICPIRPTKKENVMGLLFLGLNPRRPYDNDYRQYISLLNQKLATSLASIVLLEEEARRGRNAAEQAAYDQAMLKEKLAVQTKEANESIQMFEAVAEFVPVGMCFGDPEGNITFANDAWYKITGYPGTGPVKSSGFLACIVEEDRQMLVSQYDRLKSVNNVEFEFRVKQQANLEAPLTRTSPSFEKAGLDLSSVEDLKERHVLAAARAERAVDGSILRVLTCLTDVTAHKRAAEEAVRRAQQAENLKRMAEFATVGLYDMDLEGKLLGANNVFFEMCGLEKVDPSEVELRPWKDCVCEEDHLQITEKIETMVRQDKVQNVEVRLKTAWTADDGAGHKVIVPNRWVQATLMPVRTTEGQIQSFTGCLSDVSLQKWQLDMEKKRKEEAIESKRQQENFIDMTSHEMRNPLSAIVHCADAIIATLARVQELVSNPPCGSAACAALPRPESRDGLSLNTDISEDCSTDVIGLIESSIDSAETIVGCAQHQKRIVDDILTMSKLDSKLLAITPITVNPILMVQEALKMFEIEARRVDINLSMVVDQSYRDLGIKYLDFDPSRLKQVLINLLTNALKFTKTGPTRNVSVAISASLTRPTEAASSSKVQFIPRSEEDYFGHDPSNPAPRTRGKPVFVMFEVKDTGQGLTDEEKKSLFKRFVQASSRTHVKYGGSGLGLFISRRLTELQNGAIGVASQPGVGSTFVFYIEASIPSEEARQEAEAAALAASKMSALKLSGKVNGIGNSASRRAANGGSPSESTVITPGGSGSRPSPITPSSGSEVSTPPLFPSGLSTTFIPSTNSLSTPPPTISGILVVEDNLINQLITRRGLVNMGFNVDVANHGVECLDKLRKTDRFVFSGSDEGESSSREKKFSLSVILMDIEMPVQDGLTCTRHIRELERKGMIKGGRIPIIAVSANARMEQILEAKEAGCDDVLVKPYRMPELLEKMRVVVAQVNGNGVEKKENGEEVT
ncbi:uncharacterized protein PODANS_1_17090 [Podospora anserina S mat+]|uniref:Podospora anserina S mat+ genomic DNA chromosome 1, supercontig 4 n=1 Tax=Podospora anserina (strain S / ATCC MYA-4624 / DSM 980 / FGSC 10383) TaxID=515849 RepID=B2ATV6_PODAN|nr:uncharacterized protein PODANS_1_17090 [Podospora anserina S mat+]CAP67829.1 unnamed protein product [Podospora anserina S mat+]CDP24086.1 Putative signal transduction histidine-protein kinase [Podospora anserina S mat+]